MGLFDSIVRRGMRTVGNAVADAVAEKVADKVTDGLGLSRRDNTSNRNDSGRTVYQNDDRNLGRTAYQSTDDRSFDEKLQSVLGNISMFDIRTNVSVDELEQEAGTQIYTRGGCYAKPDAMSYVLYQGGARALIINLWSDYKYYNHYANREIAQYCKNNGIKMLNFFEYLPNEVSYMEERIRKALA